MNPILYAIGDVHGRRDLLTKMLAFIKADAAYYKARPVLYFLGDIVDRGTCSKECMELVKAALAAYPGSKLHMGNHDWWFADAVAGHVTDDSFLDDWMEFGGAMTLQSYFPDVDRKRCLEMIKEKHLDHLRLIEGSNMLTRRGPFVFVHAGIAWGKPFIEQDPGTLLFVRDEFLFHVDATGPVVIHGHTIFEDGPMVTENRISLDTGAYRTNRLSACRIRPDAKDISFFAAEGMGENVTVDEIEPKLMDRGHGTVFDRIDQLFEGDPFAAI